KRVMLQREEAIRSKSPRTVAQELWAIGTAYNLVRLEMTRIAREAGVPATRPWVAAN
ncbi:MAG: transposase, partial [Myxococcaceae bacterium]|nr:transposase [Myxococcaceae bacterium]